LGIFYILLGIPTLIIVIFNLYLQRGWWYWVYPLIFVIFIIFELFLDYIKKIEFRKPKNIRILIPYLLMYYVSIILMWGLTWTLGILYGVITGVTYFLQMLCSIYASKHEVG